MASGLSITKRPPRASAQYKVVQDEVRIGLNRVGERTVLAFNRVVANWNTKPQFTYQVGSGAKQIFLRVKAEGSTKAIQRWNWIDKTGTRPHVITVKRAKALRFSWGGPGSYHPKTSAVPARFGGSGKVQNGRIVFRKSVNHPGFPPRKFSEAILKDTEKELDREVRNGYRRGLRRAKG